MTKDDARQAFLAARDEFRRESGGKAIGCGYDAVEWAAMYDERSLLNPAERRLCKAAHLYMEVMRHGPKEAMMRKLKGL